MTKIFVYELYNFYKGDFYPTHFTGTYKEIKDYVSFYRSIGELYEPLEIVRVSDNRVVKRYEAITD